MRKYHPLIKLLISVTLLSLVFFFFLKKSTPLPSTESMAFGKPKLKEVRRFILNLTAIQ